MKKILMLMLCMDTITLLSMGKDEANEKINWKELLYVKQEISCSSAPRVMIYKPNGKRLIIGQDKIYTYETMNNDSSWYKANETELKNPLFIAYHGTKNEFAVFSKQKLSLNYPDLDPDEEYDNNQTIYEFYPNINIMKFLAYHPEWKVFIMAAQNSSVVQIITRSERQKDQFPLPSLNLQDKVESCSISASYYDMHWQFIVPSITVIGYKDGMIKEFKLPIVHKNVSNDVITLDNKVEEGACPVTTLVFNQKYPLHLATKAGKEGKYIKIFNNFFMDNGPECYQIIDNEHEIQLLKYNNFGQILAASSCQGVTLYGATQDSYEKLTCIDADIHEQAPILAFNPQQDELVIGGTYGGKGTLSFWGIDKIRKKINRLQKQARQQEKK